MDERVNQLLEQVRHTAASIGQTAGAAAHVAGKKAGQMADIAKLNLKIFDLKTEIDNTLRKMGQMMYDTHTGSEPAGEELSALLEKVDDCYAQIEVERQRINALKNTKPCPQCSSPCGQEDLFCKRCGADLGQTGKESSL